MARLPKILSDYLSDTEQRAEELSEAHLLHEAMECWYCMNTSACDYSWSDVYPDKRLKATLKRYIDGLKAKGIQPKLDYQM